MIRRLRRVEHSDSHVIVVGETVGTYHKVLNVLSC